MMIELDGSMGEGSPSEPRGQPYDRLNGVRIGAVVGAIVGGAAAAVIGAGFAFLILVGGAIGAFMGGWWASREGRD